MEANSQFSSSAEKSRRCGGFHPSVWGDYFISHTPLSSTELVWIQPRIEELKLELRRMLKEITSQHQALVLIDTMQHLGVAYHLQMEIDMALMKIFQVGLDPNAGLYTIALGFRLLRQNGLPTSSDVFNRFLEKDGDMLKDKLGSSHNVEALLSLHEATHFRTPDEKILERVSCHTRSHLQLMERDLEPYMTQMVSRALQLPRLKRVERLEARQYISIYELHQNKIEMLFEFAKLDFQRVQSIHQKELQCISIWKNEYVGLTNKLPFARDRLVELHFWMTGAYFEPCYSRARIIATKIVFMISILDDIYDQYGTPEELELLTKIINRWELKGVHKVPEYLQHFFLVLYNTVEEIREELELEHSSFRLHYLKNEIKKLANAYHMETIWGSQNLIPSVDDYLTISMKSSALPFLCCLSYIGIKEEISRDVFDWVESFPEILKALCMIGRIMNDLVSDAHEKKEKHVVGIVQCYIKQHGCTKEEAHKRLMEMVGLAWKVINKELLQLSNIPLPLIRVIINHTRVSNLFYMNKDDYTNSIGDMKDYIKLVMVDPIVRI